ncbi:hypothetical protein YC2023_120203 [Brassica napus]
MLFVCVKLRTFGSLNTNKSRVERRRSKSLLLVHLCVWCVPCHDWFWCGPRERLPNRIITSVKSRSSRLMNLRVLFLNFICINMNLLFLGFESSALFLNLKDVNFVLCEGDVVIVEDDDKNAAGKGRNLQFLRDIGNVVRRNHPKNNDPAKRALMCTTR